MPRNPNYSHQEISVTNSIGQVLKPGDKVVAIGIGFRTNIHKGIFRAAQVDKNNQVTGYMVEVAQERSRREYVENGRYEEYEYKRIPANNSYGYSYEHIPTGRFYNIVYYTVSQRRLFPCMRVYKLAD